MLAMPERQVYMIKATLTEAGNISDETYWFICAGLEHKFNENFEFERIVDKSILGGFIFKFKGKVYDRSVCSQLLRLKDFISE